MPEAIRIPPWRYPRLRPFNGFTGLERARSAQLTSWAIKAGVVSECIPRVVYRHRTGRLAAMGIALVHRDAAEVVLEFFHRVEHRVGQLLTRELSPPPGVTSRGKPELTSS